MRWLLGWSEKGADGFGCLAGDLIIPDQIIDRTKVRRDGVLRNGLAELEKDRTTELDGVVWRAQCSWSRRGSYRSSANDLPPGHPSLDLLHGQHGRPRHVRRAF